MWMHVRSNALLRLFGKKVFDIGFFFVTFTLGLEKNSKKLIYIYINMIARPW